MRAVPDALRAFQVEPMALFQEPCGGPEPCGRARGAKKQAKPAAGQKPCGVFGSSEHNAPGEIMAEAVND